MTGLILQVRQRQTQAEPLVGVIKPLLEEFAKTGFLFQTVILGDVIHSRDYIARRTVGIPARSSS